MNIDDLLDTINDINKRIVTLRNLERLCPDFFHARILLESASYLIQVGIDTIMQTERVNNSGPPVSFNLED